MSRITNGYHGSVTNKKYKKIWLRELRTNPELFQTKIIRTYDKRQDAFDAETRLQKSLDVIKNPLYINQGIGGFPPTKPGKDNPFFGKRHTLATKAKISKKMKERGFVGENNPFFGKKHTPETKQRLSLLSKRPKHSQEKKEYWSKNRREEKNGFFGKTHSSVQKAKWREIRRLARWYNDGCKSVLRTEHPGEGWILGRLPITKI